MNRNRSAGVFFPMPVCGQHSGVSASLCKPLSGQEVTEQWRLFGERDFEGTGRGEQGPGFLVCVTE